MAKPLLAFFTLVWFAIILHQCSVSGSVEGDAHIPPVPITLHMFSTADTHTEPMANTHIESDMIDSAETHTEQNPVTSYMSNTVDTHTGPNPATSYMSNTVDIHTEQDPITNFDAHNVNERIQNTPYAYALLDTTDDIPIMYAPVFQYSGFQSASHSPFPQLIAQSPQISNMFEEIKRDISASSNSNDNVQVINDDSLFTFDASRIPGLPDINDYLNAYSQDSTPRENLMNVEELDVQPKNYFVNQNHIPRATHVPVSFYEAVSFVRVLGQLYEHEPNVISAFKEIMRQCRNKTMSISDVKKNVKLLLVAQPALFQSFESFLPAINDEKSYNSGDSPK